MSDPITVMIVDDHEMVRHGAAGYLEAQSDITVVAQAESGEDAIRLAREHVPDVVLMDLVKPGMDGVEATRVVSCAFAPGFGVSLRSFQWRNARTPSAGMDIPTACSTIAHRPSCGADP